MYVELTMTVRSLMTKENIENCLQYVDQKYQEDFLELMQNIEILISEETLPVNERQSLPKDKNMTISHTYKITVLRTDFKSKAVYSYSHSGYNDDDDGDKLNPKIEPTLCNILSDIHAKYDKTDSHILREIFTNHEIMVLPSISLQ
jgi:hypothetical protein